MRWICLLLWSVCLSLPATTWAQDNKGYLATCSAQNPCELGFACAIPQGNSSGVCVYLCDVRQAACPHGEKCQVQRDGSGACLCKSDADCPPGASCSPQAQCSGARKLGEICDDKNRCQQDLYCHKGKEAKESRCYPLCNGVICSSSAPCVAVDTPPFAVCYCEENSDCPGSFCINGVCKSVGGQGEVCNDNIRCDSKLACYKEFSNEQFGRCHPTCINDKDCITGESCVPVGARKLCLCNASTSCPGGDTCVEGFCDSFPKCNKRTPCSNGKECYFPKIGLDQGICLDLCTKGDDCSGKTPCQILKGAKKACYCKTDADCGDGTTCKGHRCRSFCVKHENCPVDRLCRAGVCVLPGPEDTLPERRSIPDSGPGPEPKPRPRPDPRPTCNPPCVAPLRCNEQSLKCEKLKIGEGCDKNDDCQSGLCFTPGAPKPSICSTSDCSKCAEHGLECSSNKACYIRVSQPPPDRTPEKPTCGCAASDGSPPWFVFLLVMLVAIRLSVRASRR